MLGSSRARLVCMLVASAAATVACSAIIGVEDVTLARTKDAGERVDDGDDAAVVDRDGEVLDASTPQEASVQLALGFLHSCARKNDGKVRCWGDNGAGQLGDGVPFDAGPRSSVLEPQLVVSIDDAVDVASGVSHSCAIKKGGSVVCWGLNFFGQLGDGTTQRSSSPVAVGALNGAVALAAGTSFTCALLQGGTVSCWGANYSGQLGDGTKVDRSTAAPVKQLTDVVAIAAAEHHACAVAAAGTVKCWGKNDEGQLGNGTTIESLLPTSLASLTDVVQVVAASRFTCARSRSGQVNCWGANTLGQLGTGSPNATPNPSPALTGVSDAVSIWAGYEHACAARRSGEIVCWGDAGSGQIGSGPTAANDVIPRPAAVIGVAGGLAVATGGQRSCATTKTGAVLCWGANSQGELGNGTKDRAYSAVAVRGFP